MNGDGHRDLLAVGQDVPAAAAAVVLDDAEDVVPAAGVQARAVVAQLVEDLVHLEGGRDRFDEHGGPDGAVRQAQVLLGEGEHVVPEPGLLVGFDLRQVEVRAAALRDERCGVVEEVQPEVDQAAGCRDAGAGAVDEVQVLLHQVPAAGAHHDGRGRALAHASRPCRRRWRTVRVPRTASNRVSWPPITLPQVGLVASSWSASQTFAPEFSALIAIFRSVGPVISTRRSSRPGPAPATRQLSSERMAAVSGRKRRSRPLPRSKRRSHPQCQEVVAATAEPVVQLREEAQGVVGEDLVVPLAEASLDLDSRFGAGVQLGVHVVFP